MSKWQARLGLLFVAIAWGSSYVAMDSCMEYITVYQMQSIRYIVSALLIFLIFFKRFKHLNKRCLILGISLGFLFFISMSLHGFALNYTTVSKNAFLVVFNVVFVPIIMFIIYKSHFKKEYKIGILMMIIGFFILVFNIDIFNFTTSLSNISNQVNLNMGDYLTLLSSILFAGHIVMIGYCVKKADPIVLSALQLFIAGILAVIYCLVTKQDIPFINTTFNSTYSYILPLIYLGLIGCFSFTGQQIFQKYLSPSDCSLIFSLESVFASLFSVVLGYEPFTNALLIGGAIITLGIIMAETGFKFKQ